MPSPVEAAAGTSSEVLSIGNGFGAPRGALSVAVSCDGGVLVERVDWCIHLLASSKPPNSRQNDSVVRIIGVSRLIAADRPSRPRANECVREQGRQPKGIRFLLSPRRLRTPSAR
jgi:hypothetical protein